MIDVIRQCVGSIIPAKDLEWVSEGHGGLDGIDDEMRIAEVQPEPNVRNACRYRYADQVFSYVYSKRAIWCHQLEYLLQRNGCKIRQWRRVPCKEIGEQQLRNERKENQQSRIYFIKTEGIEAIKIGWARDFRRRINELQAGCPFTFTILGTVPGSLTDEAELHRKFSADRIRGEWFHATPELMAFINEVSK